MKKYITKKHITLSVIICAAIGFAGCEKYLDVVPTETVSSDAVFDNITNIEKIWAGLYGRTLTDYNAATDPSKPLLADRTDENKDHWGDSNDLSFNTGSWGPTNNSLDNWSYSYQSIRLANLLLENIDKATIPADKISYYQPRIIAYKAETRFLRAYQYFELLRRYGAVPLITKSYEAQEVDIVNNILRSPVDDVVKFITSECDAAAEVLPLDYNANPSQIGRITKGACMALKAIVLLYSASPLFNGNTLYANIKNPDGTQLFPQTYDNNKWKLAADAAKAVLNLGIYSLNNPNPSNPVDNYAQLFYSREYKETILPLLIYGGSRQVETALSPNGQDVNSVGGWGKGSVVQTMIDAYEMKNGIPIDEQGSGYVKDGFWNGTLWDGKAFSPVNNISNRFKDRDPRFYASIFFQYSNWVFAEHQRPIKLAYFGGSNGATDGWPKSGANCETGYMIRKWINPGVNLKGSGSSSRNYPIIRLPDMYLAYAEAMNEYQTVPTKDVYDAINAVRARVKMPGLPIIASDNTKEGMRKRIRNEWRVEFAFENHRFWDVRRWLIGTTVDNGNVYGLNSRPSAAELNATGLNPASEAAGVAVFYKEVVVQTRTFTNKHYLFPIPQVEISKNPTNLVQNYGW